jgi:hypothetical protein
LKLCKWVETKFRFDHGGSAWQWSIYICVYMII